MKAIVQLAAASFVLVTSVVAGAEGAVLPVPLTDALAVSRDRAPAILTSSARLRSVASEVPVAGMLQSPRLTVGTTTQSAQFAWSLFFALPVFGQRGTAIDAAEAQASVAAAGVDVARIDARLAVTIAWSDLWQAQQEAAVAREVAARFGRLRDAATIRFDSGGGARLDVLRADVEARRATGEVEARQSDIDAASARLALLLGAEPGRRLAVVGSPPAATTIPSDAALPGLLTMHPVATQAHGAARTADAIVVRDRRSLWPLLGLQIGGSQLNRAPPPTNDYQASLGLDVPIFATPLVDRARANQQEALTAETVANATLRSGLVAARATYVAAERRYRMTNIEVLPVAQEAADLANEAYRSGALDLTATLLAEQNVTDARLAAARALADRGRAYAALEHAAGRPL